MLIPEIILLHPPFNRNDADTHSEMKIRTRIQCSDCNAEYVKVLTKSPQTYSVQKSVHVCPGLNLSGFLMGLPKRVFSTG